jgi:hypothetical protein
MLACAVCHPREACSEFVSDKTRLSSLLCVSCVHLIELRHQRDHPAGKDTLFECREEILALALVNLIFADQILNLYVCYVCMYVYVSKYVCMYVCMYACMYA